MTRKLPDDPLDALSEAYEKMYERAADNLHKLKDSGTMLHHLIDDAKDKAVELDGLAEEDAVKLTEWLKRDLSEAAEYISEAGNDFKDWLGFETTLLESGLFYLLLETADKTTVELQQLKENAAHPSEYHTGEITGPGTLICDSCGEKLHFYKAGKIPPCPKCHATIYHRDILVD